MHGYFIACGHLHCIANLSLSLRICFLSSINHNLGHKRVYLPLHKAVNTHFEIKEEEIFYIFINTPLCISDMIKWESTNVVYFSCYMQKTAHTLFIGLYFLTSLSFCISYKPTSTYSLSTWISEKWATFMVFLVDILSLGLCFLSFGLGGSKPSV